MTTFYNQYKQARATLHTDRIESNPLSVRKLASTKYEPCLVSCASHIHGAIAPLALGRALNIT
jgi:hypothetical protein